MSSAPSWRTAYHVEQLMVPLYAGAALEVELRRRLIDLHKCVAIRTSGIFLAAFVVFFLPRNLLARAFIGAGAALILYYLLESQLLEGNILSDVERVVDFVRGGDAGEGGVVNAALLILWCFIPGFSEQTVPNLLTRTEAQLDGSAKPAEGGANKPRA